MGISFPSNNIGVVNTSSTRTNTKRGYWGSGAHDIGEDYTFSSPRSHSFREPITHGDRVNPTAYFRRGALVLSDEPVVRNLSGSDVNGSYSDTRTEYMSSFLSPEIFTDTVDKFNANSDNLRNEVTVKVLNKLRSNKASWGTNVLQAARIAEEMAHPFKTILTEFKRFKLRNLSGWLHGKQLSDAYLYFIYGVKPLMSDVYNASGALSNVICRDSNALKVKATGSMSDTFVNTDGSGTFQNHYELNVKISAGISASINDSFSSLADELGVLNPLEIAWDYLPWTFVIDWAIPVGSVLQSLSASLGLDFHSGYLTSVSEITKTSKKLDILDPGWTLVSPGSLKVGYKEIRRRVWYDFPKGELYYNNPFSTTHVGEALALLRQLM